MRFVFLKKPLAKNILSTLAVVIFGFILLNLTFLFDFLFQSSIIGFIKLFTPVDLMGNFHWFPPVMHILFMIVIGLISWFVFKSKLGALYKAIFMTVPLAVVFVTMGMFLGQWPTVVYSIGGLLFIGILFYFFAPRNLGFITTL